MKIRYKEVLSMSKQLVNFNSSIPTNSLMVYPLDCPLLLRIAAFGLTAFSTGTEVKLDLLVGLQATAGNPQVSLKLLRGTLVIASALVSTVTVDEVTNAKLSVVDNPPVGSTAYRATVEIINDTVLNQANVVGPIVFTGEAIAMG
jgi:hypothetical protein